jgi:hypothetical protein
MPSALGARPGRAGGCGRPDRAAATILRGGRPGVSWILAPTVHEDE